MGQSICHTSNMSERQSDHINRHMSSMLKQQQAKVLWRGTLGCGHVARRDRVVTTALLPRDRMDQFEDTETVDIVLDQIREPVLWDDLQKLATRDGCASTSFRTRQTVGDARGPIRIRRLLAR